MTVYGILYLGVMCFVNWIKTRKNSALSFFISISLTEIILLNASPVGIQYSVFSVFKNPQGYVIR